MNSIRVLAIKSCIRNPIRLVSYTNTLTREAKIFPGFIKSQKYWKAGSVDTLITLSDWDSVSEWNNWFRSEKREDIADFFVNHDITTETYTILVPKKPANKNFLL
jgi:alpha-L-arabinofuranosidase